MQITKIANKDTKKSPMNNKKQEIAILAEEMDLFQELWEAHLEARKGKRKTQDEAAFELNASENLVRMRDVIMKLVYKPGRGIAFITFRPVVREIFASPFRDGVVRHLLYNLNADWWDRRLGLGFRVLEF